MGSFYVVISIEYKFVIMYEMSYLEVLEILVSRGPDLQNHPLIRLCLSDKYKTLSRSTWIPSAQLT